MPSINSHPHPDATTVRHPSPNLGVVATVFVVLFLARLYPVTIFGGRPYFPGLRESANTIASFFQTAVLLCVFFISARRLHWVSSRHP